jgi:hypothetical protein
MSIEEENNGDRRRNFSTN